RTEGPAPLALPGNPSLTRICVSRVVRPLLVPRRTLGVEGYGRTEGAAAGARGPRPRARCTSVALRVLRRQAASPLLRGRRRRGGARGRGLRRVRSDRRVRRRALRRPHRRLARPRSLDAPAAARSGLLRAAVGA